MAASVFPLPYKFAPRDYQIPFLRAMDSGCKRAVLVWHRRAGKDITALQVAIKKSSQRKGGYYYYFPTAALGRKVLWEGKNNDGVKFLDYFPPGSISRKNDTEMVIETCWGSHFRIVGTDNLDVVGTNPVGTVWSEYPLQDPKAWSLVQPILRGNNGWAVFAFTPRGRNHGYELYEIAKANPAEWFHQLLTIDDTGAISRAEVEADIQAGLISRALAQQEYWTDFSLGEEGCYYAQLISEAREQGRIGSYPPDRSVATHTVWDLGIHDTTAIWWFQKIGREIRHIHAYENNNEGLEHFIRYREAVGKRLKLHYGKNFWPHDGKQREKSTGRELRRTARDMGLDVTCLPVEKKVVDEGIERVRRMLPDCTFDAVECRRGIYALEHYRQRRNEHMSTEANPVFTGPLHDASSNLSDAERYLSAALRRLGTGMTLGRVRELMEMYS